MAFETLTIAFSVNNTAVVELSDEASFRRCIGNRTLTRKTTVTVYRDEEDGVAMPAVKVPELAILFDEVLGEAPGTRRKAAAPAPPEPPLPDPSRISEETQDFAPSTASILPEPLPPPPPPAEPRHVAQSAPLPPDIPEIEPEPEIALEGVQHTPPPPAPTSMTTPKLAPPTKPKSNASGCLVWFILTVAVAAAIWWVSQPKDLTYEVPAGRTAVNIRVRPDPNSEAAAQPLTSGETFAVLGREIYDDQAHGLKTPWLKVKLPGGATGYVRESLVAPKPPARPLP